MRMSVGTRTIDYGPWSRASGTDPDTGPPHRMPGQHDGFAPLSIVWADRMHQIPVAVNDFDGCWALTTGAIDDRDIEAALLDFDQGGHVDGARIERTRQLLLGAEHWSHREGTHGQG